MWEGMGWDEKRSDEVTWGAKKSDDLRWDELWNVKCKCEAWSAGCEERSVNCNKIFASQIQIHQIQGNFRPASCGYYW